MLTCAIGTSYAQGAAVYHQRPVPTFGDLLKKLRSGDAAGDYKRPDDAVRCELPEAPQDALLVQLSVPKGQGLSTVALGGQNVETTIVQVHIEPGSRPLYVVAGSFGATIWRFTGAVSRVHRLILSSETGIPGQTYNPMPLVGATGVAEDVVFTVRRRGCLRAFDGRDSDAARAAADFVHHQSGRNVEVQVAARQASGFSLPSGAIEARSGPAPSVRHILGFEKPDEALQYQIAARWPAGITAITSDSVVSASHVELYRVLPDVAGLQQLVREGALVQLGADEFVVKRAFAFPAGISGTTYPRFLLDRKYGTSASCHFKRDNRTGGFSGVDCD